jgi:hypothetical protein
MDNSTLLPSGGALRGIRSLIAVTLCATVLTLAFSISGMVFALRASRKDSGSQPTPVPVEPALPFRYAVDEAYLLPPTDQKNVGTCWCFSTIYLLESQYRAQGIRQHLLDPDQYVWFSVQAWLRFLHDHCERQPSVKACHYGGLMHNESADQEVESLYYFYNAWTADASTSLLPTAVCPYLPAPPSGTPSWDWFQCPGYEAALEPRQNPIKWRLKNISLAYNVLGIKELLYKVKRALAIGTPLPDIVYYVPCTEPTFSGTTTCLNKTVRCPSYVGTDYCYKLVRDGREQDGVFLAATDPKYMAELGGHAMNVIGWNDEWVYRNRFQTAEASAQLKGGFILHNSWRETGHSVEYFLGNQSEENEAVICPNHVAPMNWIPVYEREIQSLIGNHTHFTNLSCCSTDIQRVRGKGLNKGADLLYGKSAPWNGTNIRYALARDDDTGDIDVKFLPSGLAQVGLIEINMTGNYTYRRTNISALPFWALSQLFAPVPETLIPNEADSCGYWMLPYLAIENIQRVNWDLLDNFRVVDIEVEFDSQSYFNHSDSHAFNTTLLQRSTLRKNPTKFDGPLPYQYIY